MIEALGWVALVVHVAWTEWRGYGRRERVSTDHLMGLLGEERLRVQALVDRVMAGDTDSLARLEGSRSKNGLSTAPAPPSTPQNAPLPSPREYLRMVEQRLSPEQMEQFTRSRDYAELRESAQQA